MSDVRTGVLGRIGERVAVETARPLLATMVHQYLRHQPRPTHDDRALVVGLDPVRVLIIGAGLAVGYGDAGGPPLPVQLARALAAELHRGVVVESRAQASIRLDRMLELIGMAGAATFDVVIWSPTLEETYRASGRRWTRCLQEVVERIRATARNQVRIVLLGVPAPDGDHPLQRLGAVMAREVDARIAGVAAQYDRVDHLSVLPMRIDAWDTPLFSAEYRQQAVARIAALLGDRQAQAVAEARSRHVEGTDHGTWTESVRRPGGRDAVPGLDERA